MKKEKALQNTARILQVAGETRTFVQSFTPDTWDPWDQRFSLLSSAVARFAKSGEEMDKAIGVICHPGTTRGWLEGNKRPLEAPADAQQVQCALEVAISRLEIMLDAQKGRCMAGDRSVNFDIGELKTSMSKLNSTWQHLLNHS